MNKIKNFSPIPIFWKYLLTWYLKVFSLSTISFVALLIVLKLKEIARFAALTNSLSNFLLFILYQIPAILPLAIPISALLASILLLRKLSYSHELTALRVAGLSLKKLITPLLYMSSLLSLLNFLICSEIAPLSYVRSREMLYEKSSLNPIVLMQRQDLLKIKNSYLDFEDEGDKCAKDLISINFNKSSKRLNLLVAENVFLENDIMIGENIAFMAYFPGYSSDNLLIENQKQMRTPSLSIAQIMKNEHLPPNLRYASMKDLLNFSKKASKKHSIESPFAEIFRRLAFGVSPFSFTFLGCCFGMEIGRKESKKKIIIASLLAFFILLCFTFGKAFKYFATLAFGVYLLPQLVILTISFWALTRLSRGIE